MKAELRSELFRRYEGNPILTAADWPSTVNAVFNPGVATLQGETVLLARVEDRTGLSHLAVASSADGLYQLDRRSRQGVPAGSGVTC